MANPTTISAPGQVGRHRFNATSSAMPAAPTASVGHRISWRRPRASHTISWTRSVCSSLMPSRCLSWLAPMRMAAAEVKPLRTGRDKKLTMNPSRPSPRAIRMRPTITASVAARPTATAGSPWDSLARPAAVSSELMAVGPTPSWRDPPMAA